MEGKRPVDVISLCSAAGDIRPLRLRLEDDNGELRRADIVDVVSVKQIPYVGAEAYVFVCRVNSGGTPGLVELEYGIRSHTWRLLGEYTGKRGERVV